MGVDESLERLQQLNLRNLTAYQSHISQFEKYFDDAFYQLLSGIEYALEPQTDGWVEEDMVLYERLNCLQDQFRALSTAAAAEFREISNEVVDACYMEENVSAQYQVYENDLVALESQVAIAKQIRSTQLDEFEQAYDDAINAAHLACRIEGKLQRLVIYCKLLLYWSMFGLTKGSKGWWGKRFADVPEMRRGLEALRNAQREREIHFQITKSTSNNLLQVLSQGREAVTSQRSRVKLINDTLEGVRRVENLLIGMKEQVGRVYRSAGLVEVFITSDQVLSSRLDFLKCMFQLLGSEDMAPPWSRSCLIGKLKARIIAVFKSKPSCQEWVEVQYQDENVPE